jgi:quinol-cytochrome oxidoreductase complex cytochrome b subunit
MRPSFFHHLHPPTIPTPQARWRYTLGAGGMALFLLLVLIATGALEAFYYIPTQAGAPGSIQTMSYLVPFGWLVRNLHFWSAQLLVGVAAIHLLRVIFTGAYIPPRRFNYWVGLALFVLILFLDFTGYALRWDSGVHWALVAGTNLLKTIPLAGPAFYAAAVGGSQIGDATVVRFYGWHIFGLTLGVVILGAWHLFRVRRDGGIAVPPPDLRPDLKRITRFELVRREALASALLGAGLIFLSTVFPAPIASPISADLSQISDVRAPWFFLWVQQLLKLGDPFVFGVLAPLMALVFLVAIPYLAPIQKKELGRWFPQSGRIIQVAVAALVLAILVLTFLAIR